MLAGDVDQSRRLRREGFVETPIPPSFCYKLKTALLKKIFFFFNQCNLVGAGCSVALSKVTLSSTSRRLVPCKSLAMFLLDTCLLPSTCCWLPGKRENQKLFSRQQHCHGSRRSSQTGRSRPALTLAPLLQGSVRH